jgi:phage/plasmid-like protein (TIGR03299 family)
MAHEIMENDTLFYVMASQRDVPWHGLGTPLTTAPTIQEAIVASGTNWEAELVALMIMDGNKAVTVPNHFAVQRQDTRQVIGVVGSRYQIYQNSVMWEFIKNFQEQSGIILDVAGTLRNGATTWVLAKTKDSKLKYQNGEVIEEYFLFRNSFDGTTPIQVMFTMVRVVCNNTLTMAIRGARNIFNVRHTMNAEEQVKQVQKALGLQYAYINKADEIIQALMKKALSATETIDLLNEKIFPLPTKIIQTVGADNQPVHELKEATKHAITARKNKIDRVLELVETGAGTDISGVRGSLWGIYNAITEYVDHERTLKTGKNRAPLEQKFENAFFGTGATFKADALDLLLEAA